MSGRPYEYDRDWSIQGRECEEERMGMCGYAVCCTARTGMALSICITVAIRPTRSAVKFPEDILGQFLGFFGGKIFETTDLRPSQHRYQHAVIEIMQI